MLASPDNHASSAPRESLPWYLRYELDAKRFGQLKEDFGWESRRIDTNTLPIDIALWQRIAHDEHVLTPETLAQYLPDYQKFHLLRETQRAIYSTNGIPQFSDKVIIGLVAPSATGKDTLLDHLMRWHKDDITKIKTTTTRERRVSQRESAGGYNFLSFEQFKALHDQNQFIEEITQGVNLYGTEFEEFLKAYKREQRIIIWRGDVAGAPKMKKFCEVLGIPYVCVGVLPGLTNKDMIDRVVTKRGTDPQEAWRLRKALYEIEELPNVADFILMNYPVEDGAGEAVTPVEAIDGLGAVLLTTIGKNF